LLKLRWRKKVLFLPKKKKTIETLKTNLKIIFQTIFDMNYCEVMEDKFLSITNELHAFETLVFKLKEKDKNEKDKEEILIIVPLKSYEILQEDSLKKGRKEQNITLN
jgi:hypothetical protein